MTNTCLICGKKLATNSFYCFDHGPGDEPEGVMHRPAPNEGQKPLDDFLGGA